MDSRVELLLARSDNELLLADRLKVLTEDEHAKELLKIPMDRTFYSAVISHAYYAIFYSAKAMLLTKGIMTASPDIHKKTFEAFKKEFVDTGVLDVQLLEIYQKLVIRAATLLEIFKDEKWKRGNFTYNTIREANKEPADDSVKNARLFVANVAKVIEKAEKSIAQLFRLSQQRGRAVALL